MRSKVFLKITLVVLSIVLLLPGVTPAHAVTTAIGGFYAGCNNFSVDIAVFGTQDDGNGFDRFRFNVTDGTNKALYVEDVQIRNGFVQGSQVVNLRYQNFPTKNPIRLAVVNLDAGGNSTGEVAFVNYNAPCLPASTDTVYRSGIFTPGIDLHGPITATTYVYDAPNGSVINLILQAGEDRKAVYRNANATWVAIFVGGNDLVWIPSGAISVNVGLLTVPPVRIFGSGYGQGQNEAAGALGSSAPGRTVPAPFSGQTTVRATVKLRAAPTTASAVLEYVPRNSTVTVLGRNKARNWVKINFNGMDGWVTSYYVKISSTDLRNLAIVP